MKRLLAMALVAIVFPALVHPASATPDPPADAVDRGARAADAARPGDAPSHDAACVQALPRSGSYLFERLDVIVPSELGIEAQLEADMRRGMRQGWMEVDADARRVSMFTPQQEAPRTAVFSHDCAALVSDSGDVMAAAVIDGGRFSVAIELFGEYRVIYRPVDADSDALAHVRQARDRVLAHAVQARARQQAALGELAERVVELDVRQPLPEGEASLALPADVSIVGHMGRYTLQGKSIGGRVDILVPGMEEAAEAEAAFEQTRARAEAMMEAPLQDIEDGLWLGIDHFDDYRLLARGDIDGRPVLLTARLEAREVPVVIAMWRSLDAPVERMMPLRTLAFPAPDGLVGQAAFDAGVDAVLQELLEPRQLVAARKLQPGLAQPSFYADIPLAEGEDGFDAVRLGAELLDGAPDAVLERFAPHRVAPGIGIAFYDSGCAAHAAVAVDTGYRRRPFTLLLRQPRPGDYASCLATATALGGYGLQRPRRVDVHTDLLDHFARYDGVLRYQDGLLRIREDGRYGVLAPDGRLLLAAEYDDIGMRGKLPGFTVTRDGRKGYADADGRIVIAPVHAELDERGPVLVATDDADRRGVFSPAGDLLVAQAYDRIVPTDADLLQLYQGDRMAIFDPATAQIVIPMSAGLTYFNEIGDSARFIAQGADGHALYDVRGRALISGADEIRRVDAGKVAVRQAADGMYRFHDLDGKLLSPSEYASVWANHQAGLISVRDAAGSRFFLDFELNRRTPEGLNAVYLPTEGGYAVVADSGRPPRMGMAAPDGTLALPVAFRQVYSMREGLIAAQARDGGWGLWDATGTQVLAPEWQALSQSFEGTMYARADGLWRLIDRSGAALDERRWYEVHMVFRNIGDHPPFALARRADGDAGPAWDVLDMQGVRLLEETFDAVEVDGPGGAGGVRLIRDGQSRPYPD